MALDHPCGDSKTVATALNVAGSPCPMGNAVSETDVWNALRAEAVAGSGREPSVAAALQESILNRTDLADALTHRISAGLGLAVGHGPQPFIASALTADPAIIRAAAADLAGIAARDPSLKTHLPAFLTFKGYLAVQAWRVSHWLWQQGRCDLARWLHATAAEATGVSLDPSAILGTSVFLDHGTGIVIGPLVRVGDGVTIFQNVLIGRSSDAADGAPTIGHGCFIGSDAIVVGPVTLGDFAKIGAGALVDRDVPAGCTAVGAPLRFVNCPTPAERALVSF
jgi:serine O-acetyltransferase